MADAHLNGTQLSAENESHIVVAVSQKLCSKYSSTFSGSFGCSFGIACDICQ